MRRTLADAGGGLTLEDRLDTPKSDEARTVELGVEVTEALRRHVAHRLEQNLRNGWSQERSPWLFVTEKGTPMDASRVRLAFAAVLKAAALPRRFTPHSLRHTFATLMLMKGAPLTWVSAQLGHSSPEVTLRWYWWALPGGDKAHARLLDSPKPLAALAAAATPSNAVTSGDQTTVSRNKRSRQVVVGTGAGGRDRTDDLLITKTLGEPGAPDTTAAHSPSAEAHRGVYCPGPQGPVLPTEARADSQGHEWSGRDRSPWALVEQ